MADRGIIIVSNRLPIAIKEVSGELRAERAIGGAATALDAVVRRFGATWVGWTGLPRILPAQELASVRLPENFAPVQAGASTIRRYYDRFSNQLLWPILHSMFTPFMPDARDWAAYRAMNRSFAEAAQGAITSSDDLVWVHDYHLMLVPQYLREAGVTNRIGFFLHTPFPPPEFIFDISHAHELLAGLCVADVLGFQTARDVHNFWQCYKLTSGLRRPGLAGAFPIGVDFGTYRDTKSQLSVRRAKGKRVIFSISRLDYTKGIVSQLLAVERFLADYPQREELLYKLVVAPSREQLGAYRDLKSRIEHVVQKINRRLGTGRWKPVDFTYQNLGLEEVVAWYRAADVLLLLPEMDGMNLIAKEYIAARHDDEGMLVLSTAMGASYQLSEALLVDAHDTEAAAAALANAQAMSASERSGRWQALRDTVQNQDVFWWAGHFVDVLASR